MSVSVAHKQGVDCSGITKMDKYKIIKEVGNGTFGSVWRALNKLTGEVVAIKMIKKRYCSWEECINLREVKSLMKMNHPNIVQLKEVIRECDILYFVFEYMECNLYHLMKDRDKFFSEDEVKKWCFQVFQGLVHMHQRGYFHRDLKPENLLVSKNIIKIADFGLAREINSRPPYTDYVSTRWYRAPEVLLQSVSYGPAVDMWAMGAIMAELFNLRAIFPGSSEADEIYKICSVIGSPTKSQWAAGLELASVMKYQFPKVARIPLSVLIPSASEDAVNLITLLCSWDPCKRPTAAEALQHPFFKSCFYIPPFLRPKAAFAKTPPSGGAKATLVQNPGLSYSQVFPDLKSTNKLTKSQAPLHAVAQRKLDLNSQEEQKYTKTSVKQPPRYQHPAKKAPMANNPMRKTLGDTTEKLANMEIRYNEVSKYPNPNPQQQQQQQQPLLMKAGGWHVQPGRTFIRKVAG